MMQHTPPMIIGSPILFAKITHASYNPGYLWYNALIIIYGYQSAFNTRLVMAMLKRSFFSLNFTYMDVPMRRNGNEFTIKFHHCYQFDDGLDSIGLCVHIASLAGRGASKWSMSHANNNALQSLPIFYYDTVNQWLPKPHTHVTHLLVNEYSISRGKTFMRHHGVEWIQPSSIQQTKVVCNITWGNFYQGTGGGLMSSFFVV